MRKNIKNWPTKKLVEVLDDSMTRSCVGTDFGPYREEIEQEYWKRLAKYNLDFINSILASEVEFEETKDI